LSENTTQREINPETMRSASTRPETWDESDNSVEVCFSTGARCRKRDRITGEVYLEDLPLDGMDLSELNQGAHVLRAHDTWGLESILGSVVPGSARIEGGEALARVRLSTTPSDAEITSKIKTGIVRKWSYGYARVGDPVISFDEAEGCQVRTWAVHKPYEISPVPVPADSGTGTRSRESKEDIVKDQTPVVETTKTDEDALRQARIEGARLEAARQAEIRKIASKVRLGETDIRALLDDPAVDVTAARERILDMVAERDAAVETHPQHSGVTAGGRDEGDTRIRAISAALDVRMGVAKDAELPEYARDLRGARLLDLAAARLEMSGIRTRGRTPTEVAEMALHSGTRAGAHTTSDFPLLTANSLQKVLVAQRDILADYRWFERIAARNDFSDFKARSYVRLSGLGVLPEVPEGMEYGSVTMGEGREQASAVKFGAEFPLTLELMVNDDLGGFLRLVRAFGRSAIITASRQCALLLSTPQTMADGIALFHADHANLSTSGGAPDVDKLAELDGFLRAQTDGAGEVIGLPGAYLLLPGTWRKATEQLFSPQYRPTTAANALTVDIPTDRRLYVPSFTGKSYYMATGDPSAFEYGYLAGEGGPVVTSYQRETSDALVYHGRMVFGCRVLDHRAFACNPGA